MFAEFMAFNLHDKAQIAKITQIGASGIASEAISKLVGVSDTADRYLKGTIDGSSKQFEIFFEFNPAEFIQDVFVFDPFLNSINEIGVDTMIEGSYQSCGNIA